MRSHSSKDSPTRRDRVRGCLLGGAIGDGIGHAFEGLERVEYVEPEVFVLSDDTQLTLATCEAIIEAGAAEPSVIAERFVAWFNSGKLTGLGASTLKALRDLRDGAHWALAGRKGEHAAGNGAAMRIAPVALCVDPAALEGRRLIRDVCRITHDNDEAFAGALAVALCVHRGLSEGLAPDLAVLLDELPDTLVRDRLRKLEGVATRSLGDIAKEHGNSGYVVESVPFAIIAAARANAENFADVLRGVVSAGGDTDTNASIFGQIVGARIGEDRLPDAWLQKLPSESRTTIVQFAAHLARTLSLLPP